MSDSANSAKTGLLKVSWPRYSSDKYLIKRERYKYLRPVIINNWEKFRCEEGKARLESDKMKIQAQHVEGMLKKKFDIKDDQIVKLYNLHKDDLISRLKVEASRVPTQGKQRPDVFMCFVIAGGKDDFFYENKTDKNLNSEKIYFKEIAEIFNGDSCRGLVLRPKLFFIQTECEKELPQCGGLFALSSDRLSTTEKSIPVEADFLVYTMSHPEPELSELSFIKFLCQEMEQDQSDNILNMTIKVNKTVNEKMQSIPLCTCQLTKELFL